MTDKPELETLAADALAIFQDRLQDPVFKFVLSAAVTFGIAFGMVTYKTVTEQRKRRKAEADD